MAGRSLCLSRRLDCYAHSLDLRCELGQLFPCGCLLLGHAHECAVALQALFDGTDVVALKRVPLGLHVGEVQLRFSELVSLRGLIARRACCRLLALCD